MKSIALCLLPLIVLTQTLNAQKTVQPTSFTNLVLEGGGVRGFAYAGAFEVLDSLGVLKNIERVGGTSVGAIEATLLALSYTSVEMKEIAANIPLKKFNDGFLPGGFSRMKKRFGFFKGEKITVWIGDLIAAKTGDADITFMQLHNLKTEKNYKDLYITGTDLSSRCLRVFSYEGYPNMRIKDALRIFEPILIDDAWKVQKSIANRSLHFMVDGGLIANYPIQIFDSTKYISDADAANVFQPNPATLGLLLDRPNQLQYGYNQQRNSLLIRNLNEYLSAVYQTIIDKPNPDNNSLRRTIAISHLNISGRVRRLPKSTIEKLMESGREGVRKFFLRSEM